MPPIQPPRLGVGDHVRVIAPSFSGSIISETTRTYAREVFENELKLEVSFSDHLDEIDKFNTSSIASRIEDLHAAFADTNIKAVIPIIGGWSCNQLLQHINWDLVRDNPKIFCGFSDINVLGNAILAKSGLITYSGPNYSTFGQKTLDPYTVESFRSAAFDSAPYHIEPSAYWSDDQWFINQDDRNPIKNDGYWVIQKGRHEGLITGGTLSVYNLLRGTRYFPDYDEILLFLEDEARMPIGQFDAYLQALIHTMGERRKKIGGLVIGRFPMSNNITREQITEVIDAKPDLNDIPILANVDFGHTDPKTTFPIGGIGLLDADEEVTRLEIIRH